MTDSDNTQDDAAMSPASTGSVAGGSDPDLLAAEVRRLQAVVASLQPFTLTDRERFVLREVRDIYAAADDTIRGIGIVSVIDALLERTGGGK